MERKYIGTREICEMYQRSPRTLSRWQQKNGFPKPIISGGHGSEARWRESDIIAWEESRLQSS